MVSMPQLRISNSRVNVSPVLPEVKKSRVLLTSLRSGAKNDSSLSSKTSMQTIKIGNDNPKILKAIDSLSIASNIRKRLLHLSFSSKMAAVESRSSTTEVPQESIFSSQNRRTYFNEIYGSTKYNLSQVFPLEYYEGYYAAPVSSRDKARVKEVKNILNSKRWKSYLPEFNMIRTSALNVFQAKEAYISLITETEQVNKIRSSEMVDVVLRPISLDAHAILSQDIFFLPDASTDWRFAQNPQVDGRTSGMKKSPIRFFASVAVKSLTGQAIGAISVFDSQPRAKISNEQVHGLMSLARQVTQLIYGKSRDLTKKSGFLAGKIDISIFKGNYVLDTTFREVFKAKFGNGENDALPKLLHYSPPQSKDSDVEKFTWAEARSFSSDSEHKKEATISLDSLESYRLPKESVKHHNQQCEEGEPFYVQQPESIQNNEIKLLIERISKKHVAVPDFVENVCRLMCELLELDMVYILYISASALYHVPQADYPFDLTPFSKREYTSYPYNNKKIDDEKKGHDSTTQSEDWLLNPETGLADRIAQRAGMIVRKVAGDIQKLSLDELTQLTPNNFCEIPQVNYWKALVPVSPIGNIDSIVEFNLESNKSGVLMPLGEVRRVCFPTEEKVEDMKRSEWLNTHYFKPDNSWSNYEDYDDNNEPKISMISVRYNADAMMMAGMRDEAKVPTDITPRDRDSRSNRPNLELCRLLQSELWDYINGMKDSELSRNWIRMPKPPGINYWRDFKSGNRYC